MNDILQQLIGMGPGIGAAVGGNGQAFASFMNGWNRAQQRDEQRKRLQQQDSLAMQDRALGLEDRQRGIERQTAADEVAAQQRTQQQALQGMQIPEHLAKLGSVAEDPQGAQALIESAMPNLMKAFGQESMAYGMPAVEMATRTITGRQRSQVVAFLDQWKASEHVEAYRDVPPEQIDIKLPEHLQRYLGKPSASLAELQQFAQLPVGKPAGKTRIPPATGSMEEFSDPSITPERKAQILADRKAYMQSDDRPMAGADPEIGLLRKDLLRMQVERAGEPKEPNQTQFTSAGFAGRMEQAEPILTSVAPSIVGMSMPSFELQTNSWFAKPTFQSQDVQSYMQAARNFINSVLRRESGAVISPEEFREARAQYLPIAGDTPQALAQKAANRKTVIDTMRRSAGGAYEPPVTPGGPKPGERRKIKGVLAEWDGKGWLPVK